MKCTNRNTNGSLKSRKKAANFLDIATDNELDELLGGEDSFSKSRDSFLKAHCDPDGNICLSPDEVSAALGEIDALADEQLESVYALTALAYAFLGLGHGAQLACADGTALSGVAIAQAGRARTNAARIRSLFSAIDARCSKPAV